MKKALSCFNTSIGLYLLICLILFFSSQNAVAQCGPASFAGPGIPYTPTTSWQQTQATGSGTYQTFNVTGGNIYSFYISNVGSSTPNVYTSNGTDWDMTLSQSSAIINYDDVNSPIRNSFTGGIGCPLTTRPTSSVWYSTFSGQLSVSLNTFIPNNCFGYVAGQSSALLNYTECVPTGDPGPGLSGSWNVDAFATTALTIPNYRARYGYYNDISSGLDFNTQNYWLPTGVPSDASGWTGCVVSPQNYTARARRKGFPCGLYTIQVNSANDSLGVYLNGTELFVSGCCIASATTAGNAAGYILGANDILEYRLTGVCSPNQTSINLVPGTVAPINGGTIADTTNSTYACTASPLGYFANIVSATGGAAAYTNGGSLTYQWQISTDGGSTWHNTGVTTATWNSLDTVPAGLTYVIRREAIDHCGNIGYSNLITLIGVTSPNANFTPKVQSICPGGSANLTVNFTVGQGPYNIYYTDGANNYSNAGVNSGVVVTVTPAVSANVVFTKISDAHGCTTTSYFDGGASILIEPQLTIPNVTSVPASCFGGTDGQLIVTANGGLPPFTYSDDNGGTFQPSNTFTGLAPGGTYNIVVHDSLGCSATYVANPVGITQPTAMSESLSETDASCSNVYNGTITVTASGGTPGYTYSLNGGPSQTSNVITGVLAGTYEVFAIDKKGCLDSVSITVNNAYTVALQVDTFNNESCYGSGDGSVTVHLIGGTPSYSYSLNGGPYQSSGTFTGLVAGNYTIAGKDAKGCTEYASVTIAQPGQLTVLIDSIVNGTCASNGNGAVYVNILGGTPGYTYSWTNGATSQNDTALVGGRSYNVTVTDSKGCTATNGAFVAQTYPLSLNIALFTNPFCNGDSAGVVLASANGGVPPYNYAWSNGAVTQDIDSIPSGTYTLTVTDASGCQSTISQTLSDPPVITDVVTGTNVVCYGTNSGTASVSVSGGVPPYTYQWSNLQNSSSVTGLTGGLYNVQITDHNGCHKLDSIRIAEPAQLQVSLTVTNISCFNANDGSIAAAVTGGAAPYTYTWNPSESGSNPTGLSGGVYELTVTDSSGCSVTASATVINPAPIVVTFNVKNALCYNDQNGAIYTTVSGGFPGYTFQWSNGFTSQDVTGLSGGLPSTGCTNYILTITDSHSCSTVDSAAVCEPGALYTSGIINNASCHDNCDGSVITTPYGGTGPYSFNWSNSESTENIVQLCGGNYYLTLTDANGCSVVSQYIVNNPAALTLNLLKTDNSCFGACNGSLVAISGGGTQPYRYLWNNFSFDSLQNNVCSGLYTLMLTDSNHCQISDTASVLQPAQLNIAGVVTDLTCYNDKSGAITTTVTGGVTPYNYLWSNSAVTPNLTGLDSNTYLLTVTDANNCIQSASFNVTQPSAISPAVSMSMPLCKGGGNGFISVDVTGGAQPYVYNWNTNPAQSGATASNLYAGNYTLTITDQHGCSVTVADSLSDPPAISINASPIGSKCFNDASGGVVGTVISGGVPPFTFMLNGVLQSSDTFGHLAPGTYSILVIDANGCQASDTFSVPAPSPFYVTLTTDDQFILTGMKTQLTANVTSSVPITHYGWSPMTIDSVDVFDFSGCGDPTDCNNPFAAPPVTTTFTVSAYTADSCFVTDTITINVENQPVSFIPTAFTPNGDGLNDYFEFAVLGATTIEINIFDRWGAKVYYNPNQNGGAKGTDGWDGNVNGKPAPDGTYVYQMKITYFNSTVTNKAGTIEIIR